MSGKKGSVEKQRQRATPGTVTWVWRKRPLHPAVAAERDVRELFEHYQSRIKDALKMTTDA